MKKLLTLVLVLCCFTACKKDNVNNKSQLTLLTSQSWKPALFDSNTATNPSGTNTYYALLNCEQDDSYTFTDNKLTIDRASTLCSYSSNIDVSDYSIDFNQKRITIKGIPYILAELSATQLKYYAPSPGISGYTNVIFIYRH